MRTESPLICRRAHKDLMQALERARSRLAIAAATDARLTPLKRRRDYMEMEERIRRCLKELRLRQHTERHLPSAVASGLLHQLSSTLRRETGYGDAHKLCQQLQEILLCLERIPGEM
jgi:hypothetical protein